MVKKPKEKGTGTNAGGAGEASTQAPTVEASTEGAATSKKNKFRRDKPWDHEGIDHWKVVPISKEDVPKGGLLTEESSFATLFPQYREQYLKQVWPDVKKVLGEHDLVGDLNLVEGSMTVRTTRKTWDPYIIIKARDMIKLLARSVPLPQAQKILEDEMHCDIIKISGLVTTKDRFVKRRQRLVGPNGSTLKAIELLTGCHVMVQGRTVSVMGTIRGLKEIRRIIEDCMRNIHPIYHIKELMIRRELEKDPDLKEENWERFLPHFKRRNVQRKKIKLKKKKSKEVFPPQQTPRKEDIMMESGEYFLNEQEKERRRQVEQRQKQIVKSQQKKLERAKEFEPPAPVKVKKQKASAEAEGESAKEIAERLKSKVQPSQAKKRKRASDMLL